MQGKNASLLVAHRIRYIFPAVARYIAVQHAASNPGYILSYSTGVPDPVHEEGKAEKEMMLHSVQI